MPKFTIDIGKEFNDQLSEVAKDKGVTKADIVRRALATYIVVNREAKEGNRIMVSNPQGQQTKELVCP